MNIDYLVEFVLLAETRSFRKTAEKLFITTSTLSKHIISIEDEVGTRLFKREQTQTALTEAGKAFYEGVKQTLLSYELAKERAYRASLTSAETLRVGYIYGVGKPILKQFLLLAGKHFPGVQIDASNMTVHEIKNALVTNELDVAFSIEHVEVASTEYNALELYSEPICALVTDSHPLAYRESISVYDIDLESLIVPNPVTQESAYSHYMRIFGGNPPSNVIGYYDNPQSLFLDIDSGIGTGLISRIAESDCNVSNLVFVPINAPELLTSTVMLYRESLDEETKSLLKTIQRQLRSLFQE